MATKIQIERVWDKAKKVRGKNADWYREDIHGNPIYKTSYGKQSSMGWKISHIKPKSKGGTDSIGNLQALHCKVNRKNTRPKRQAAKTESSAKKIQNMPIKIRHIAIKNYKRIDSLELDFPPPRMSYDPDILVIGSKNGIGKTSIMECCALLLLAVTVEEKKISLGDHHSTLHPAVSIPDLLIKAGKFYTEIAGEIYLGNEPMSVKMKIDREGTVKVSKEPSTKDIRKDIPKFEGNISDFIKDICGFSPDPVATNSFLFFHSYRKVQEGNLDLGMMVVRDIEKGDFKRLLNQNFPISGFKIKILRSLMAQANLFELKEDSQPDEIIKQFNEFVKTYARGKISKLKPRFDNTIEFLVNPIGDGKGGSFSFDGLSSGQKEAISTLFLIWYHTRQRPCVVFIDEPELHLNAEWHRSFIRELLSSAPLNQNQYVIATHSKYVMGSVDKSQRILIVDDG